MQHFFKGDRIWRSDTRANGYGSARTNRYKYSIYVEDRGTWPLCSYTLHNYGRISYGFFQDSYLCLGVESWNSAVRHSDWDWLGRRVQEPVHDGRKSPACRIITGHGRMR